MNLQRYVSTVYCETIRLKDKNGKIPEEIEELDKKLKSVHDVVSTESKVETFQEIRNKYLSKSMKHVATKDVVAKDVVAKEENKATEKEKKPEKVYSFLMEELFSEKIFGNTLQHLMSDRHNTVVLFPVYREKPNVSRLKENIRDIYSDLVVTPTTKEFDRDPDTGNLYLFIPALSEDEESKEEYTERMGIYLDRAFDYILDQKPKRIGNVLEKKEKLETILYTVNKEGGLFTDYYKKKIPVAKEKILNEKIEKWAQKLGGRLLTPIDSLKKFTKEDSLKKYREEFGQVGDKDKVYLKAFDKLVDQFLEVYKIANDEEYRRMVSSRENQSVYRIFYRIHNTDVEDVYDEVKPGSTHVYELYLPEFYKEKVKAEATYKYGYFNERKGETNQYIFKEYEGISEQQRKVRDAKVKNAPKEQIETLEQIVIDSIEELEEKKEEKKKEVIVEVKKKGGQLRFKLVKNDFTNQYPGYIRPFKDLHIYERYKWFHFNELSGTLPPESKIKYYKNLRFDRSSMIDFLKFKKEYTDKTRVAVEFLKINLDSTKLSEYAGFLISNKNSTHVYKDSAFGVKLPAFIEKTKSSIVDLLFQSNELLYTSGQKSTKEKIDISKNYKIVGHQYYKVDLQTTDDKIQKRKESAKSFFEREIYDNVEKDYCKRKKCELFDEIEENPPNTEFSITIVDVTKENVEVVEDLKQKTKCKRLRKTLRKQLRPFVDLLLPRFYGGTRRRRLTRRQNRH